MFEEKIMEICEWVQRVNMNIKKTSDLLISKKAHLILPTHKLLDAASEKSKGKKINFQNKEYIGPTISQPQKYFYEDYNSGRKLYSHMKN